MLVADLNATSANPGHETALRPSAPTPPVGDPRREQKAGSGLGADHAEEERDSGGEGGTEGARSATGTSIEGEALQARALVAAFGEERARLAYDNKLSRVFVELLDPRTGEVITRFPPERLVEQLNRLANDDDTAPVDGLRKLVGAGDEPRSGGDVTGKVLDQLV